MMCGRRERRAAIVLDASAIAMTKQKPAEAGCPIASFEGYFFSGSALAGAAGASVAAGAAAGAAGAAAGAAGAADAFAAGDWLCESPCPPA